MPEPEELKAQEEEAKPQKEKKKKITSKYQHSFPNVLEEVEKI